MCGKTDLYESFRALNVDWIDRALDALDSVDREETIAAIHSIAASGVVDAIPALVDKLDDKEEQWTRLIAVYASGALGQPAVQPLVNSLLDAAADKDELQLLLGVVPRQLWVSLLLQLAFADSHWCAFTRLLSSCC